MFQKQAETLWLDSGQTAKVKMSLANVYNGCMTSPAVWGKYVCKEISICIARFREKWHL